MPFKCVVALLLVLALAGCFNNEVPVPDETQAAIMDQSAFDDNSQFAQ